MTGNAMDSEEGTDNVHYCEADCMADPLDLSTGGNKADTSSNRLHSMDSRPRPVPVPSAESLPPRVAHMAAQVTCSSYTPSPVPRNQGEMSCSTRHWSFPADSASSTIPQPRLGDLSQPSDMHRLPLSHGGSFPPVSNGTPIFPSSTLDRSVEEPRDVNDVDSVNNGVESLGLLQARPSWDNSTSFPDNALFYNQAQTLARNGILLQPSSISALSLPSTYDPTHMTSSIGLTAPIFNRKRRQEQRERERKDKEATCKTSCSTATVTSAQASSNSQDNGEDSDGKKSKLVPEEKKDEAYWERRRKNNEAAKRSRDARRQKEEEIAVRANWLEQENLKLRAEITVLKNETAKLHCLLLNRRL